MKGDIDLGGNRIFNVANSSNDTSAVNKSYVDSGLNKCLPIDGSSAMQGELSLDLHPLTDLPEPKFPNDATYLDNSLNSKMDKTLSSDFDLNHRQPKLASLQTAVENLNAL